MGFNASSPTVSANQASNNRPLESDGKQFEVLKSAKILGFTVRDDLEWNDHINNVTVKASQRVYLLKQLKRAAIDQWRI